MVSLIYPYSASLNTKGPQSRKLWGDIEVHPGINYDCIEETEPMPLTGLAKTPTHPFFFLDFFSDFFFYFLTPSFLSFINLKGNLTQVQSVLNLFKMKLFNEQDDLQRKISRKKITQKHTLSYVFIFWVWFFRDRCERII